jgi:hypothetical protein
MFYWAFKLSFPSSSWQAKKKKGKEASLAEMIIENGDSTSESWQIQAGKLEICTEFGFIY